jgi:aspartate/tyrosine/aromatic aminotransferase
MPYSMNKLPILERDEAFAITADFLADTDPRKVSLGAGVYRDENSKPWVLPSVTLVRQPFGDIISLSDCLYRCRSS